MRVKDLIKELQKFNENLQVAIFNDEFCSHSTQVSLKISKKEDEISEPYEPDENLEDVFLSIE